MSGADYRIRLASGREIRLSSPTPPERDPDTGNLRIFDGTGDTVAVIPPGLEKGGWLTLSEKRVVAMNRRPVVDTHDLDKATHKAWKIIATANERDDAAQFIFRYGGQPSRFEHTEERRLKPVTLNAPRMRYRLSEIARWAAHDGKGFQQGAPSGIVSNVLATPDPPLPVIKRIVETPILRPDGSVLTRAGYDAKSEVFYEPSKGLEVPRVASRPSKADQRKALRLVRRELLADFPFTSEAERAHAIALFLQPFVRDLIDGPTPLYLVEAPTPGSGKGLLVDAACWPAIGARVPLMAEGGGEDEWRKRITSTLLDSPPTILIDNIQDRLDSAALSMVLTATEWTDRRLGASENVALPNRATWVVTGNNPGLSGEMMRRSVRIRLDPDTDHPEDRTGFRHPDLRGWAAEHRGELVWAALTLARAWIAAGRPKADRSIGSFERWSDVMGGILKVAGVAGFLSNLKELREHGGSEREAMYEFLSKWHAEHGDKAIVAKQVDWSMTELLGLDPSSPAAMKRLGKRLSSERDRRYREFVLHRGSTSRGGAATWRVEKVGEAGG